MSVLNSAKKIGNNIGEIAHNYPKLPKFPLGDEK